MTHKKGSYGWLCEQAKIYGFEGRIREFTIWAQCNGIFKSSTDINREDKENTARNKGYKNYNELQRVERKEYKTDWMRDNRHKTGENLPMDVNRNCASNLGVYKSETIFKKFLEQVAFDNVISTGYQDGGIDFYCKNPRKEFIEKYPYLFQDKSSNKEYRIQLTTRCITYDNKCDWSGWKYFIDYNAKPDIWILCAYDNLDNLHVIHSWLFHRKSNVRKGRGNYIFEEFYKRSGFSISNTSNGIKQLDQFEFKKEDLNILNEICDILKEKRPSDQISLNA